MATKAGTIINIGTVGCGKIFSQSHRSSWRPCESSKVEGLPWKERADIQGASILAVPTGSKVAGE